MKIYKKVPGTWEFFSKITKEGTSAGTKQRTNWCLGGIYIPLFKILYQRGGSKISYHLHVICITIRGTHVFVNYDFFFRMTLKLLRIEQKNCCNLHCKKLFGEHQTILSAGDYNHIRYVQITVIFCQVISEFFLIYIGSFPIGSPHFDLSRNFPFSTSAVLGPWKNSSFSVSVSIYLDLHSYHFRAQPATALRS